MHQSRSVPLESGTSSNCRAVPPSDGLPRSFAILGKRFCCCQWDWHLGFGFAATGLIAEPITIYTYIYIYIHGHPPQDLPKSFFNGIYTINFIFSYTQFHYSFESDLRLLDVTKHCKTKYVSTCTHLNCQKTIYFQRIFTIWLF